MCLCLCSDEWYGAGVEDRVLAHQTGCGAQREVSPALGADSHLQRGLGGGVGQWGELRPTVSAELVAGTLGTRVLAIQTPT